jgi:hypothetical protein
MHSVVRITIKSKMAYSFKKCEARHKAVLECTNCLTRREAIEHTAFKELRIASDLVVTLRQEKRTLNEALQGAISKNDELYDNMLSCSQALKEEVRRRRAAEEELKKSKAEAVLSDRTVIETKALLSSRERELERFERFVEMNSRDTQIANLETSNLKLKAKLDEARGEIEDKERFGEQTLQKINKYCSFISARLTDLPDFHALFRGRFKSPEDFRVDDYQDILKVLRFVADLLDYEAQKAKSTAEYSEVEFDHKHFTSSRCQSSERSMLMQSEKATNTPDSAYPKPLHAWSPKALTDEGSQRETPTSYPARSQTNYRSQTPPAYPGLSSHREEPQCYQGVPRTSNRLELPRPSTSQSNSKGEYPSTYLAMSQSVSRGAKHETPSLGRDSSFTNLYKDSGAEELCETPKGFKVGRDTSFREELSDTSGLIEVISLQNEQLNRLNRQITETMLSSKTLLSTPRGVEGRTRSAVRVFRKPEETEDHGTAEGPRTLKKVLSERDIPITLGPKAATAAEPNQLGSPRAAKPPANLKASTLMRAMSKPAENRLDVPEQELPGKTEFLKAGKGSLSERVMSPVASLRAPNARAGLSRRPAEMKEKVLKTMPILHPSDGWTSVGEYFKHSDDDENRRSQEPQTATSPIA